MRLVHHRGLALLAGLERQAHEHGALVAEFLHLRLAEAEARRGMADRADVRRAGLGLQLDERPALEVDAEVQPHREEQHHRGERERRREREGEPPEAHEVHMRFVGPEAEQAHWCQT